MANEAITTPVCTKTPERIQRKRSRGWRMPEGVVYVGRGSRYGNPFGFNTRGEIMPNSIAAASFRAFVNEHSEWCPIPLHKWPKGKIPGEGSYTSIEDVKRELRGKTLACWCALGEPCHADFLLELANG